MPDPLRFHIVTPERRLLQVKDIRKVRLLLADGGWISIYPGHAPLLAETAAGAITYTGPAGDATIAVAEGILHITGNDVTVFTGGMEGSEFAAMRVSSQDEMADDIQFDRLARVLLISLRAHTTGIFDEAEG